MNPVKHGPKGMRATLATPELSRADAEARMVELQIAADNYDLAAVGHTMTCTFWADGHPCTCGAFAYEIERAQKAIADAS